MGTETRDFGPGPDAGNDADLAVRFALACQQCLDPAPCSMSCPQGADLRRVMRWIGQGACAGFSLTRWAAARQEQASVQAVTEALVQKYN